MACTMAAYTIAAQTTPRPYRVTSTDEVDAGTTWRYVSFYIPLWLVIAAEAGSYCAVRRSVTGALAASSSDTSAGAVAQRKMVSSYIASVALYPIVLVCCWTVPTINRIQNSASPRSPQLWLTVIAAITVRLQGLLNALVYGLTPRYVTLAISFDDTIQQ
jgi:G protein-coupled glucose receptor regulating Gpa2 C-term